MYSVVLFCLISLVFGQGNSNGNNNNGNGNRQQFSAVFQMREPSMTNGAVVGEIFYDFKVGRMLIDFQGQGVTELYQHNHKKGYGVEGVNNQWLYKDGKTCSCETTSLKKAMPVLFPDNQNGSPTRNGDDTVYRPGNVEQKEKLSPLVSVTFGSDSVIKSFQLKDGKSFTLTNVVYDSIPSSKFDPPQGCKCGRPIDIVVVMDRSGSISVQEFANQKSFLEQFSQQYDYGPLKANLGITNFNRLVWDTLELNQGYSERQVQVGVQTVQCCADANLDNPFDSCCCCGTSISSGIRRGTKMFNTQTRKRAAKVLIVITDGNHNTPYDDALGYGSETGCLSGPQCQTDLQEAVDIAKATIPGVSIYAIAVGTDIANVVLQEQLTIIADGHEERILRPGSFSDLAANTLPLVSQTCDENETPCGACCGFCVCGQCNPPDLCEVDNECEVASVRGSCCTKADVPETKCQEPNKCFSYVCDKTLNDGKGACSKTKNVTCPPSNACETYKCDSTKGECIKERQTSCDTNICEDPKVCDDGSNCTKDICDPDTGCSWETIPCDDGNACTISRCTADGGCEHTPRDPDFCNDNNACTINRCNPDAKTPEELCISENITCHNSDLCTEVRCNPNVGCETIPLACPIVGACTLAGCNASFGCFVTSRECAAPVTVGAGVGVGATVGVVVGITAGVCGASGGGVAAFSAGGGAGSAGFVQPNPLYAGTGYSGSSALYRAGN